MLAILSGIKIDTIFQKNKKEITLFLSHLI